MRTGGSVSFTPTLTCECDVVCVCLQENTLVSFSTAAVMGADFIEFDIMVTSDKLSDGALAVVMGIGNHYSQSCYYYCLI